MERFSLLERPAREYSPLPFWFLNGDLTDRSIQINIMNSASDVLRIYVYNDCAVLIQE